MGTDMSTIAPTVHPKEAAVSASPSSVSRKNVRRIATRASAVKMGMAMPLLMLVNGDMVHWITCNA